MEEKPDISKTARALSALGNSKGGKTRAANLSSEERKAIARSAAEARWAKSNADGENVPRVTHGSPDHPLKIGEIEIPCYVLDDGRRILSQNGVVTALGLSIGGGFRDPGEGNRLTEFISSKSLKPFISERLRMMFINPIRFKSPRGGVFAHGYEATILADVCDAVLEARRSPSMNYQLRPVAARCEVLVRAFARVGIVALVDEATGYQEMRDRTALQEILKKYISAALLEWAKMFPMDFYHEIYRLRGWEWKGHKRMSQQVGRYTKDLVYQRLAPGVLDELERKNPVTEKGYRAHKHHQWLTRDVGHPALSQHLYQVLGMMRASNSWKSFLEVMDRTFPKLNSTLPLRLEDATKAAA